MKKLIQIFFIIFYFLFFRFSLTTGHIPPASSELNQLLQKVQHTLSLGNYSTALEQLQKALEIAEKTKNDEMAGFIQTAIGEVYIFLNQYDNAFQHLEESLTVNRKAGNQHGEASVLVAIGVIYMNLGQYEKAMSYQHEALKIFREIKDKMGESFSLSNIATVYDYMGQYMKALEYHNHALSINKEIRYLRGIADNYSNIGVIYTNLSQYKKALSYFKQALHLHKEIGDRKGENSDFLNLGSACLYLNQYENSLTYFKKSLAVAQETKNHIIEGQALGNIGSIYYELSQYKQALKNFDKALKIHQQIGNQRDEAATFTNIGILYDELDKYDEALENYEKALEIQKKIGDRYGEGKNMLNIGVIYKRQKYYEKALRFYESALSIYQKIGNRSGESSALLNSGLIYENFEQFEKAIEKYKQSLLIGIEIQKNEIVWKAKRGIASAQIKLKYYDEAIHNLEQAINIIESMREHISGKEFKIGFMFNKFYVYDELIDLLQVLHRKQPDKGYDRKSAEIFERKQGRIFLEEMGQSGARNFAGIPESIMNKENELNTGLSQLQKKRADEGSKPEKERDMKKIKELEQQIEHVKSEQQKLQEQIRNEYPEYHALKYPKPASLKELQNNVLKPGEMMLVYGVMEKQTCLWMIGKKHFSLNTINSGSEELEKKIEAFRKWAARRSSRDLRGDIIRMKTEKTAESSDLYALLFPQSVRKTLSGAKTLYIIPTGPLYQLPFEALNTGNNPEKPHYLIEDYSVVYLSSASLLKIIRQSQTRRKHRPEYPLLAFANPVYGEQAESDDKSIRGIKNESYRSLMGGKFTPLPETEDEVRSIRNILNAPEKSNPLRLQSEASLSTVMKLNQSQTLDDYRYLVFACHGVIPETTSIIQQPALVLSNPDPETKQDGFLTMADVFGLKMNADLVTLSACNTGRGKSVSGEGVMGLTRSFMYAGTPAVTVTLWSVESLSAKELNVGLFEKLKAGKNRAQALREIKLEMINGSFGEEWQHPYYWAPLVMFGDGN